MDWWRGWWYKILLGSVLYVRCLWVGSSLFTDIYYFLFHSFYNPMAPGKENFWRHKKKGRSKRWKAIYFFFHLFFTEWTFCREMFYSLFIHRLPHCHLFFTISLITIRMLILSRTFIYSFKQIKELDRSSRPVWVCDVAKVLSLLCVCVNEGGGDSIMTEYRR